MSMQTLGSDIALSLVIPCFNEVDNALLVVDRLMELHKSLSYPVEVIFVDGGSSDGTPEDLKRRIDEHGLTNVCVVVMPQKRGYGYDIMYGLGQAKGDVLAWTHADMQTDLKDVFDGYELYQNSIPENPNLVIKGKRLKRPLLDAFFTFGMQMFTLVTLRANINEINAQPKIFSRSFFEQHMLEGAPDDFSLDLFLLYKARKNNYKIHAMPVIFADRMHGEAKGGGGDLRLKYTLVKRTVSYILKLRKGLMK